MEGPNHRACAKRGVKAVRIALHYPKSDALRRAKGAGPTRALG